MTVCGATDACTAAGLHVLDAAVVGTQVRVVVEQPRVLPETYIGKLGVPVTVSFADTAGRVTLWFEAG